MFTTSKLLHWSTTVTMFLPMSWTSPLTVAMTILPRARVSPPAAAICQLLGLDERQQVRDRLLHDARRLDHLRQEHLAGAEQVADDVHAVHQRAFDHLDRPPAFGGHRRAHLLGVLDDEGGDALHQRMREALRDRLLRAIPGPLPSSRRRPSAWRRTRSGVRSASCPLGRIRRQVGGSVAPRLSTMSSTRARSSGSSWS